MTKNGNHSGITKITPQRKQSNNFFTKFPPPRKQPCLQNLKGILGIIQRQITSSEDMHYSFCALEPTHFTKFNFVSPSQKKIFTAVIFEKLLNDAFKYNTHFF